MRQTLAAVLPPVLLAGTLAARAEEGMWTFDNFPSELVAERHGVEIGPEWLERVRLGVARLSGCTASFVSPEGLLLTNNHCVQSCLAQHSSREASLIESGFLANGRSEELRCGTQIADVLVEMEDVTGEVQQALAGLDALAANERRKETLTRLEERCEEESQPLKCQAVTLYDGGQYFLYKYDRYDDVRLVFTPELGIAAFGGDPDNFQFPRWCLDMALLRVYRDGEPAATPNHLRIDFAGPEEGELVLVVGNPGATDRQLTVEQLRTIRNVDLPPTLLRSSELRGRYLQFASGAPEAERIVRDPLNGLENGIKVRRKLLDALHDDEMLTRKAAEERELRERARASAGVLGDDDPWARIAAAQRVARAVALPHTFLEQAAGFNSALFRYARTLVRGAEERTKPNGERLREYVDTALPRIEQQLRAPVPVYRELERLTLSFSLERMREWLGPDHPVVRRLLATESPESLARRLVEGSRLANPEVRMALWNGGQAAVDAADDPMIGLARSLDGEARAIRKRYEDEVEAPVDLASEAIAAARFAVYGTDVYPDATGTLRINFGTVRGWEENGVPVAPFTELGRLYERATGEPPFALPERWLDAKRRLDPRTRFNLVSTNDIVGGNSGSPLLNARGNVVGLIFDGNIHSIAGRYWFDEEMNRAVSVHTAIMRTALESVYEADALLEELGVRR